ncbi:MAG: hypothetical protein ACK4TP_17440 [Hyphomicrobium sp.]
MTETGFTSTENCSAGSTIAGADLTPNGGAVSYTPEPAANDTAPAAAADTGAASEPRKSEATPRLYKPIDLIVANIAHSGGLLLQGAARLGIDADGLAEAIARKILCEIAHDASPTKVLFALGAIGGPASLEDVAQRLQAARDAAAAA